MAGSSAWNTASLHKPHTRNARVRGLSSLSPVDSRRLKETFVRRTVRLVVALFVLGALAAPAALAAERMWIGFHDDPSFRWVGDRAVRIQTSGQTNASIMRLLVQWNLAAKTRPADAADPFDPAYILDDIDEAVRAAQDNDQEVVLTISGTPRWANGGKSPNVMPTRLLLPQPEAKSLTTKPPPSSGSNLRIFPQT